MNLLAFPDVFGAASPWAPRLAWAAAIGIAVASEAFRRRQQAGANGGPLSRAKQIWLATAIYTWFVLAPLLVLDAAVPAAVRWVLAAFCLAMLGRGPAELVMLYVTRNWRPPYGIAHTALSALVLVVTALAFSAPLGEASGNLTASSIGFLGLLLGTLLAEVGYAAAFFRVVGGRTVGDDAVWFAPADDPAYRAIVRWTAALNVFFLAGLGAFLIAYAGQRP